MVKKKPARKPDQKKKILLTTVTGEPFQPSRIYYQINSPDRIQKIFSKLRCMDYDPEQARWVWLYHAESKKIKFQISYSKIPRKLRPIVIGSFFLKKENEMFLNLNSFDRVIEAVIFFAKYIPGDLARPTHMELVNKFFSVTKPVAPRHEDFFDNKSVKIKSFETNLDQLLEKAPIEDDRSDIAAAALAEINQAMKTPLPEVERLPVNLLEDGVEAVKARLMMRTLIAHKHWSGHKNYTFHDLMADIGPNL